MNIVVREVFAKVETLDEAVAFVRNLQLVLPDRARVIRAADGARKAYLRDGVYVVPVGQRFVVQFDEDVMQTFVVRVIPA